MKVAIIGSGVSGLAAAHALYGQADVTLFEAGSYFGGHTHTVDVCLPTPQGMLTHGVDTGFLVFNERTYPNFIALLDQLDVPRVKSDMSFSVQVPRTVGGAMLEWSGSNLNTVFAQRRNLLDRRFLKMLRDLLRFNALATTLAGQLGSHGTGAELMQPLGSFLRAHAFSAEFRDWYLLPMIGSIWSCPADQMLQFPVATMVRFCHNHGLLQVRDRPQWWTVAGGARRYVDKIVARIPDRRLRSRVRAVERDAAGVRVCTDGRSERFDKLVLATHSDQALALLREPSQAEQQTLGAIRYQANQAVLHTDASVLPRSRSAWAAWNYEQGAGDASMQVCLHYLINRLQPLPFAQPVLVTLNPQRAIEERLVLGRYDYDHPVFDLAAVRAQAGVAQLQGQRHTYFCGAWMGYGFHEDGLKAGTQAATAMLQDAGRMPQRMAA